MEPLWKKLRPRTANEFLGNPIEVKALEQRTGAILVDGEYGCGKTSAALVLGSAVLGKTIPYLGDTWGGNGDMGYGRHLMADDFDARGFKQESGLAGCHVFIVDEAQTLNKGQITALHGLIEKAWKRSLYILVTTEPVKLGSPLRSRCYQVHMRKLNSAERETLAQRGWTAMEKSGPVPDELLRAMEKFDDVTIPRVILNIVEKYALGTDAEQAVLDCRC